MPQPYSYPSDVSDDDPASGVEHALAWAEPGDVLLLLVLSHRDAALEAVREAGGVPA